MAKYQYRVAGNLDWLSNSGNALLAISNPRGSGKKLTIRRVEIAPLGFITSPSGAAIGVTGSVPSFLSLTRGAASRTGQRVAMTRHNSNAPAFPATISVLRQDHFVPSSTLRRITIQKQSNGINYLSHEHGIGSLAGSYNRNFKDTSVERITVRNGEAVGLCSTFTGISLPFRVSLTVTVRDTATSLSWTYSASFFAALTHLSSSLFTLENNSSGAYIAYVSDVTIEEVGSTNSPYFQLLHVTGVSEEQNVTQIKADPLDSLYPDHASFFQLRTDAAVLPLGANENALSDASPATILKGFNYIKTKDFTGPVIRTYFPEYVHYNNPGTLMSGNFLVTGQKWNDIFAREADIVVREGDCLALVSAAETATLASAIDVTGYQDIDFAFVIDVEPAVTPELRLTGLKVGTEVRVYRAGTTTELAGQEQVNSGSFSWTFDPSEVSAVDISILSLAFQNVRILGIATESSNIVIPVQQQIDRQYANN